MEVSYLNRNFNSGNEVKLLKILSLKYTVKTRTCVNWTITPVCAFKATKFTHRFRDSIMDNISYQG